MDREGREGEIRERGDTGIRKYEKERIRSIPYGESTSYSVCTAFFTGFTDSLGPLHSASSSLESIGLPKFSKLRLSISLIFN